MKSNYKSLGQYISEVDIRNINLDNIKLLGVSIQKVLMPSIANIIGTDMSTYKIIKKNQFAYGPVTSRNGDKISIALLDEYERALISQAYICFEIIDTNILLPEYLMMWLRRPEFDRYARFMSHGSAREIFSWEDMCNIELPVPSITKQREIVKEYNVVVDIISLNNRLIQKLEQTAQAIYKQWFVDFEFPEESGMRYKSNKGEMEYNKEIDKEIPKGWRVIPLKEFCIDMKSGGTPSRDNIEFWNKNEIPWIKTGEIYNNILISAEEFITNLGLKMSSAKLLPKDTVLMSMYGVNAGQIGLLKFTSTTNQACCGMICKNSNESAYLYYHLLYNQEFISSQAIGGAQENLNKDFIEKIFILKPIGSLLSSNAFKYIINYKESLTRESEKLKLISNLLLSKLATLEDNP